MCCQTTCGHEPSSSWVRLLGGRDGVGGMQGMAAWLTCRVWGRWDVAAFTGPGPPASARVVSANSQPRPAPCLPALLAGPTVATAGLALQVPLAVLLDGLLRSPPWLSHAGSTVLTLAGGAVVLCGFFGVNAAGEDDEKTRHSLWEERQEVRPGARGGSANGCPSWLPASQPAAFWGCSPVPLMQCGLLPHINLFLPCLLAIGAAAGAGF